MPIKSLDTVVLMRNLPEHALQPGDLGTVVEVYGAREGFEVEFVSGAGATVALVTLQPKDLRPVGSSDILSARSRSAA
jgi:hypothetical protein